jgi:hypothetical protein
MPCVGFEHTIPASERAKTVHASDRSATVTGRIGEQLTIIIVKYSLKCSAPPEDRLVKIETCNGFYITESDGGVVHLTPNNVTDQNGFY